MWMKADAVATFQNKTFKNQFKLFFVIGCASWLKKSIAIILHFTMADDSFLFLFNAILYNILYAAIVSIDWLVKKTIISGNEHIITELKLQSL